MGILGTLKGGSQILAKTAIANYIVAVEKVVPVPVNRNDLLQSIQDKCGLVEGGDFSKLSHDVNDLCVVINNQQLDYLDRAGNVAFNIHKTINSPAQIKKSMEEAQAQLEKELSVLST